MRRRTVAILGSGHVARAAARLILRRDAWWAGREGFSFRVHSIPGGAIAGHGGPGLWVETESRLDALAIAPPTPGVLPSVEDLLGLLGAEPGIVVDASPRWQTTSLLLEAVRRGHAIVLASDAPLIADVASFRILTADRRGRCEAAVAGGLPVASALESALDGGDPVLAVDADLGPHGSSDAWEPPLAPPDRVARQALVLDRLLGGDRRLEAVQVAPEDGGWLATVGSVRVRAAAATPDDVPGARPRATVTLTTALQRDPPLQISGPLPSPERLAAAVLRDLLALAREEDKPWRVDRRSRAGAGQAIR